MCRAYSFKVDLLVKHHNDNTVFGLKDKPETSTVVGTDYLLLHESGRRKNLGCASNS